MGVNPLPWEEEVEARIERTCVFTEGVDDINGTLGNRAHVEPCAYEAGDQHCNQEDNGGDWSKYGKAGSKQKEQDASSDAEPPEDGICTRVIKDCTLQNCQSE